MDKCEATKCFVNFSKCIKNAFDYFAYSTIRGRNFVLDLFSLTNKEGFIVNYTVICDGLDLLLLLLLLLVGWPSIYIIYTTLKSYNTRSFN